MPRYEYCLPLCSHKLQPQYFVPIMDMDFSAGNMDYLFGSMTN